MNPPLLMGVGVLASLLVMAWSGLYFYSEHAMRGTDLPVVASLRKGDAAAGKRLARIHRGGRARRLRLGLSAAGSNRRSRREWKAGRRTGRMESCALRLSLVLPEPQTARRVLIGDRGTSLQPVAPWSSLGPIRTSAFGRFLPVRFSPDAGSCGRERGRIDCRQCSSASRFARAKATPCTLAPIPASLNDGARRHHARGHAALPRHWLRALR